ncbi:MAG: hypothetical protein WB992_26470 [Bryobacteraceae bacterium]
MTITQEDIEKGLALRVEYLGGRTVTIKGATTGRDYTFSGMHRIQDVDPRDTAGLFRDGMFKLKGITRGKE